MKCIRIYAVVFTLIMASTGARSQNLLVEPLAYGESVTPVTAVKVAVTVEKQRVVPGPYARYAQKYMGSIPPLSERTTYSIKTASIAAGSYTAGLSAMPGTDVPSLSVIPNVYNPADFATFAIDRTSATEMSAENMAREAANTIFTLRKRRFDLITGEAGENVFGGGMAAAIEEMARMEEEYVSLFMGKTSVETSTVVFEVVPEQGKTNYVVCRFSAEDGVVPESDLSAAPILLVLTPENAAAPVARTDKKAGNAYRVAAWATAILLDGTEAIASQRVPVFQFGETVYGK